MRKEAHLDRMLSIIDGNNTSPSGATLLRLPPQPSTDMPLATVSVARPKVPSAIISTPVRKVAADPCCCVDNPLPPRFAVVVACSRELRPVSDCRRNSSKMSRFRHVCKGPSSRVGHFLRQSSISTLRTRGKGTSNA